MIQSVKTGKKARLNSIKTSSLEKHRKNNSQNP